MSFYTGDHRANIPTHTTQEVKARMKKTLQTEMLKHFLIASKEFLQCIGDTTSAGLTEYCTKKTPHHKDKICYSYLYTLSRM